MTVDEMSPSETFVYTKKWIKHISLLTSLSMVIFLLLIIYYQDFLLKIVYQQFKVVNLFLILFFFLFTLIAVLFSNKIRRENLFKQKNTNLGNYTFLIGFMAINSLLLYISFENYYIFDIINVYLLVVVAIVLVGFGLYSNYTYFDENIYFWAISQKNYAFRITLSMLFIVSYAILNFYFGYLFIFVVLLFWIDLLFSKIIIPVIVRTAVAVARLVKSVSLFIIALPDLIYNLFKRVITYFNTVAHKSYTKTVTLSVKLDFSKLNILTVLLFSFGFSLLFNQIEVLLLIVFFLQILFIYYLFSNLNKLYYNLDNYQPDQGFESRYFYQLYGSLFLATLFIFEIFNYLFFQFISINSTVVVFSAVGLIILSLILCVYHPLVAILLWFAMVSKIIVLKLYSFLSNIVRSLTVFPTSSPRIIVTSLALILIVAYHPVLYLLYFFLVVILFYFMRSFPSFQQEFALLLSAKMNQVDITTDLDKKLFSTKLKLYVYAALSLILLLVFLPIPLFYQQYLQSFYLAYGSILVLILVNSAFIFHVIKVSTLKTVHAVLNLSLYLKRNTYDKIKYIYEINVEYGFITPIRMARLEFNTFIVSLLILFLLYPSSIHILFVVFISVLILVFYLLFMEQLYHRIKKITTHEYKPVSEQQKLFNMLKDFVFDSQKMEVKTISSELQKTQTDTRIFLLIPAILLTNIFFFIFNIYLVPNVLLVAALSLLSLFVVNLTFFSNLFRTIALAMYSAIQVIAIFMYNVIYSFGVLLVKLVRLTLVVLNKLAIGLYTITVKKGKKSLTLDFTLLLPLGFILGSVFARSTSFPDFFTIWYFLLLYGLGLAIIWYELVMQALIRIGLSIYQALYKIGMSIYTITVLNGRKSASLDLFILTGLAILTSDLVIGYDFSRTLIIACLFLASLALIWSATIIVYVVKAIDFSILKIKRIGYVMKQAFNRLLLVIQYVIKEVVNWSLFYVSILFSLIFIVFGIAYVISGLLNDSGKFITSIFFDINLLFGLANITNIILLLLGVAFIFAGLVLMRIINENKQRLFLHVFEIHTKQYEVMK